MIFDAVRLAVFTGEFGCGKSEIAVNAAVDAAKDGRAIALLDLDVVKAHFRSRQAADAVRAAGVDMVAPVGDLAQFELPAINPRVPGLLRDHDARVIVDIGGSTDGLRVFRSLGDYIPDGDGQLYLVVNPYRPYSRTPQQIRESYFRIIEAAVRDSAVLVSNPHLGAQTDRDIVARGHNLVLEAARDLRSPIAALCVRRDIAGEIGEDVSLGTPIYPIDLYLRTPWERNRMNAEGSDVGEAQDQRRTVQGL